MAIEISPTEFSSVARDTDFTATVSATATEEEIIESVELIPSFDIEEELLLEITNGTTSATVGGKYLSRFTDTLKYVTKGSSDLIETPTTIVGLGNMPPNKDLFSLVCDESQTATATYTVLVTYDGGAEAEFTISQTVNNNFGAYKTWLTEYIEEYG